MNINKPKVSIVCASYNHEKYVSNFIHSVLKQTFTNFELIIVDDKSSDNNLKIIKTFNDSRIKIIEHKYNQGPSNSINDGIIVSRGDYIAFLASDDEVYPTYLQEGIRFLERHKKLDALCFQLDGIDQDSNFLKDKYFQTTLKFKNIKYYQLINNMFTKGNMIPAPGEIVKRSLFESIGLLNQALLQTQDYDFHIRTLLKHQIYVYQKPLIKYRQGNNNIDNHNQISNLRQSLETPFVLDNFLNMDIDLFKKVFHKECKPIGKPTQETIPYFLGMIAQGTKDSTRQKWGYQTLIKFIQNSKNLNLINNLYSIEYKNIISIINDMIPS